MLLSTAITQLRDDVAQAQGLKGDDLRSYKYLVDLHADPNALAEAELIQRAKQDNTPAVLALATFLEAESQDLRLFI